MTLGEQLRAVASPSTLTLRAGQSAHVAVTMDNRSPIVDQFELRVAGLDTAWFDVETARISLFPGESGSFTVTVHPPTATPVLAGPYAAQLIVTSGHDPSSQAIVGLRIEVPLEQRIDIDLRPGRVVTRGSARFSASLTNRGNAEQLLDLRVVDADLALHCRLDQDRVAIAAGSTIELGLRVQPRKRPFFGIPKYHPFGLEVADPAEPAGSALASADATLVYRPRLAFAASVVRVIRSLATLLLVVLIGLAVIVWTLGAPGERLVDDQQARGEAANQDTAAAAAAPENASVPGGGALGMAATAAGPAGAAAGGPGSNAAGGAQQAAPPAIPAPLATTTAVVGPPPVIVTFEVRAPADLPAGQIQLVWEVKNADEVTIGGVSLPPAGTVQVQGLQQGEVELVARNQSGIARRSVGVVVLRPPEVLEFGGTTEIAQAGQAATLNWRLARAERARLFGPDLDPLGQNVDANEGTLQVRPTSDALYTLVAENAYGRVQEILPLHVVQPAASPTPAQAAVANATPTPVLSR
jgi:hypothetical protein